MNAEDNAVGGDPATDDGTATTTSPTPVPLVPSHVGMILADVAASLRAAQPYAPLLPRNAQIALALASAAAEMFGAAARQGTDVSDVDLEALFDADARAKDADARALAGLEEQRRQDSVGGFTGLARPA